MLTLKASDLRAKRSLVVLTGANLSLGTTTAPASSKHSIAEPIAVSSWKTAGVLESLGLTVFLFLIRGRCKTPFEASNVCCRHEDQALRIQRPSIYGAGQDSLLVLVRSIRRTPANILGKRHEVTSCI